MSGILYGIPYMGSKTKIAVDILKKLPKGDRFVDLFGGGFAMSHAAILTNRYRKVLYNDLNALLVTLISQSLNGKYNYNKFKPKFICREEFNIKKDTDGYIKYIWSFGNNGQAYMFSKEIEPYKKAAHDFVVFGQHSKLLNEIAPNVYNSVKSMSIHNRRIQFCGYCKKTKGRFDLQRLEQLERLERLQQLERLERPILKTSNISYKDYEYQDGDVVYLDPPYENTAEYDGGFNSHEFYDWCISRPYQVWFSSYNITDKRFKLVWAKQHRSSLGAKNASINFECLYTNKS